MQNEPSNLDESLWRQSTSKSKAPGASPDAELELRLTEALSRLKNAHVPSNFTARIMDEINREEMREARAPRWHWHWHGNLWPRFAGAAAALLLAVMMVQHHETAAHRVQLARTLETVADMRSVPSVDALNNFEAIQAMGQRAHADEELLALVQ
jgi:hypothetical protein